MARELRGLNDKCKPQELLQCSVDKPVILLIILIPLSLAEN
jgi:hypothetical protein